MKDWLSRLAWRTPILGRYLMGRLMVETVLEAATRMRHAQYASTATYMVQHPVHKMTEEERNRVRQRLAITRTAAEADFYSALDWYMTARGDEPEYDAEVPERPENITPEENGA